MKIDQTCGSPSILRPNSDSARPANHYRLSQLTANYNDFGIGLTKFPDRGISATQLQRTVTELSLLTAYKAIFSDYAHRRPLLRW